jgi:hypothetical protein
MAVADVCNNIVVVAGECIIVSPTLLDVTSERVSVGVTLLGVAETTLAEDGELIGGGMNSVGVAGSMVDALLAFCVVGIGVNDTSGIQNMLILMQSTKTRQDPLSSMSVPS